MADSDGGFGTVDVEVGAGEQQLTEADITPQGVVQPEPDFGQQDEQDGGDWTESISDPALREKVKGKGYDSPEALAKAYAEAESKIGQGSSEVAQLRQMVEELSAQVNQQPAPTPPQAQEGPTLPDYSQMSIYARQVAQQIQEGNLDTEAGIADLFSVMSDLAAAREQHLAETLRNEMRETVQYATEPLNDFRQQAGYQQQIRTMQREYGEDLYGQLAPRAGELLREWGRNDPNFIRNPTSIGVAFDRAYRETSLAQRRAQEAETLNGAGPGPSGREVDPAQMVVESILNAGGGPSSGGFA